MADIIIEPISFVSGPSGVPIVTSFTDSFNRGSGQLGLNWAEFIATATGNGLLANPGIGLCTDAAQGMIVSSLGAGGKADSIMWSVPLVNTSVIGLQQFSQFDLISELGTSSFCGPAVAVDPGGTSFCSYGIAYRNLTWRLSRMVGVTETTLLGPTAIVIPCTLRINVTFNGAISNTLNVLRNGVNIGNFVDVAGSIVSRGVPGFLLGAPSAGDNTEWRNFSGGIGL